MLFFINDGDDEDDRYFRARFCGNGKCIYSPFGNVTLIICDADDLFNSFEDNFLGNTIISGDTKGNVVDI
jgi:hypothetical protein